MSPLSKRSLLTAAEDYGDPFVGPYDLTATVRLDVSTLTTDEVDANGYIKPGTPIQLPGNVGTGPPAGAAGALVGAADHRAGVVPEPIKITTGNANLATDPDLDIVIVFQCAINRDIVEDNLGRVLSANELLALRAGNVEILE